MLKMDPGWIRAQNETLYRRRFDPSLAMTVKQLQDILDQYSETTRVLIAAKRTKPKPLAAVEQAELDGAIYLCSPDCLKVTP